LPSQFVLKATHGSGWNLICRDKSKLNWKAWKRVFNNRLKHDIYVYGREWNYKNLKPRIIVEKYMEDDSGELRDYKIFCMNGTARFMLIEEGRFSNHHRAYIDRTGDNMGIRDSKPFLKEYFFGEVQGKMFELADELCKPFPHVRIDFYLCNDNIYFGEFTFFNDSGFAKYEPDSADDLIGGMLMLPEPNYNLDLLNNILPRKC
jgi:hypothetical protein